MTGTENRRVQRGLPRRERVLGGMGWGRVHVSARRASVCAGACPSLCTCTWCRCAGMLDLECVGLRARAGACTCV